MPQDCFCYRLWLYGDFATFVVSNNSMGTISSGFDGFCLLNLCGLREAITAQLGGVQGDTICKCVGSLVP